MDKETKQDIQENNELSTGIPRYSELSEEDKIIVDNYIGQINLKLPQTINGFCDSEIGEINREIDLMIGLLNIHSTRIKDMQEELILTIDENTEQEKEKFGDKVKRVFSKQGLKKSTTGGNNKKYTRIKEINNVDLIQEKIETIRTELKINACKFEIIAQNSDEQYANIQYQIIALEEVLNRIQKAYGRRITRKYFFTNRWYTDRRTYKK